MIRVWKNDIDNSNERKLSDRVQRLESLFAELSEEENLPEPVRKKIKDLIEEV